VRVGTLEVRLGLPGVNSLKEKRRIVRSLKDRIRNKFNVAVAEVDNNDVWRSASLGIAAVANDARFIDSALSKVLDFIRTHGDITLGDYDLEVF